MTDPFDWLKFGAWLGALTFCAVAWAFVILTLGSRVSALLERITK